MALTYEKAGVNPELADRFVERISALTRSTLNRRVKAAVGGYASLYALDAKRWIAASTDGVGTKLKLAFLANRHDTIGIDLVAMSVNDLICVGAEPLFFLDYFATGKLVPELGESVLRGIVAGCRQARCALVGGETAEMPDFYAPGEYDLAGFAVGFVEPKRVLPRKDVRPGDVLLGVRSSGVHSNGYSLVRKLWEAENAAERARLLPLLLEPTRIYVRSFAPLLAKGWIKGLAHITGSGLLNVPRISERVSYEIRLPSLSERPEVYAWLDRAAGLTLADRAKTFNGGIGMVVAVDVKRAKEVAKSLRRSGETVWELGKVVKSRGRKSLVRVVDGAESTELEY